MERARKRVLHIGNFATALLLGGVGERTIQIVGTLSFWTNVER